MALDTSLWARKTKVTIDSALVVGSVAGFCAVLTKHAFITNAPEFLSSTNANRPKADGSDLRITTDEAGLHELPFEIEQYTQNATPSSAVVQIWTRIPSVSDTEDTEIWVWWGNAAASAYVVGSTYGRNAVWVDYLMVMHAAARYVTVAGASDSTGSFNVRTWEQFSTIAAVLATADLPNFGAAISSNIYSGGIKSTCLTNQFLDQMDFSVESFVRLNPSPSSGALFGATSGGTDTDVGTDQGGTWGASIIAFGGSERYASVSINGTSVQVENSGLSKITEGATYTWMTVGRRSGFARMYIGDGLMYAADLSGLVTSAYTTTALTTGGANSNHYLSEWRISRKPPDEARHLTSRAMVRNITTMILAAAPQSGPYVATSPIVISGLVTGSRVKITRADNGSVLSTGVESGGVYSYSSTYTGLVVIEARKATSAPYYRPWTASGTVGAGLSVTALQLRDD